MKKRLFLLIPTLMFCSCATIFTGSKKKVTFDSDVKQPIALTIDGFKIGTVTLPFTLKIKGGFDETVVKAETQGYAPSVLFINKTFNAVSVLNLFDALGWGIDAATGALMKPEYKVYRIEFTPEDDDSEKEKE